MTNTCPVCAYPDLYEPAYDGDIGSDEICPSCGYQFGWSDDDQHISHNQARQQWIADGMSWYGKGIKQPLNWNPKLQ